MFDEIKFDVRVTSHIPQLLCTALTGAQARPVLTRSCLLQGGFYFSLIAHMGHDPLEMQKLFQVRCSACGSLEATRRRC